MKISWRLKLMITTLATVAGAIIVTWVLNNFLLERYYTARKVNSLKSTYIEIEQILDNYYVAEDDNQSASVSTDVFSCSLMNVCGEVKTLRSMSAGNIIKDGDDEKGTDDGKDNILKDDFDPGFKPGDRRMPGKDNEINAETNTENFLSDADARKIEACANRLNLAIYIRWKYGYSFSTVGGEGQNQVFSDRITQFSKNRWNFDNDGKMIYEDSAGRYQIKQVYDVRTADSYIELFSADAEDGSFVLIRTNVESMKESVKIANNFLLYAGILVLLIACAVMMIASKSAVRPINELSEIAKCMSRLDFSTKYLGAANDEIGELGESINELSDKLEQTISDLKSANNRLQSDIEQKTQIDEMRKEFLSNVTHELKTPIALISGYAEGLKDCINNDDDESRDYYCDVIMDEAGKMNTMVKKLLTLNQIEFGQQMVELERFDICEVISSIINSSDVLLRNKNIKTYLNFTGPLDVWADAYMIEEVLTNYITNAINHCENENVIDIKAERAEEKIRVSVFNTGKPIPDEELEKIWVKFYKVDKARTREYGGTGIGLSIVKAIMDAHNEPYGVINHANGVEFWIELDSNAKV